MDLINKPAQTFRGDFSFRNSDAAILRFPFPFEGDSYMYAVNIEPHVQTGPTAAYDAFFDLDEHYVAECEERALVLEEDKLRCQVLPHMMDAEWDTLELLMENLARDYPAQFTLSKNGDAWRWVNRPLGLDHSFTFGDAATLPYPPFEYITRQVQGDFTLQDQRDDNLFMDGGMVTSQADWSLNFDLGMTFHEWHGPVPLAHELGVFDRALKYLLRLQVGQARAAAELDADRQSAAGHLAGKLSALGPGPADRDAGKRGRENVPAGRVANPHPAAAQQRHPVRHPRLPDPAGGTGRASANGPPACTASCATCRRNWSTTKAWPATGTPSLIIWRLSMTGGI